MSGPGLPLPHTQRVAARGGFGGFARCAAARHGLELGPLPPHPARFCCSAAARSALTGTSTRGAARADRVAPMAYVSGVVAVAIGITADLCAARRGRVREVSGAAKVRACATRGHVCGCWRRRMPPLLLRRCPGVTRPGRTRLTRVVCRALAGPSAVAAPSPRPNPASRVGRGMARSGRSGRCTRASAVGAARADCGSVGGVHRSRAARWLAGAAAVRPPRAGA